MKLLSWFKPSPERRVINRYQPTVARINALEPKLTQLSDSELKAVVVQHKGKNLTELEPFIPEIFAAVREAARRTLQMRHFDVQLMGGLSLLSSHIAEMKTGEGKTLVATLPLTVHALTGQGAHLVTVNDYLATRDASWMAPIYSFFDLSVGVSKHGQSYAEKKAAYAADITYGTNNEFGFDYLRDNMSEQAEHMVQRPLSYAIIDEVDSILIDEARTPLIISAPDSESTRLYEQFSRLIPQLQANLHYNIDEKRRAANLTDDGISAVEKMLGISNMYEERGIRFVHHLEQALRAYTLYHRDKDYVVQDGQVIIVDEFTGRLMPGRRYSEGLHQAIEAKEKVPVQQETRTLATITFQNFFRLYKKIAGMTGTAATSREEFEKVYNLEVEIIPTNKTMIRLDKTDRIYVNEEAKFKAVVNEIKQRVSGGQPVLVGTIAIEKSEYLSALLNTEGIRHEVLNAKHHAREAEIISQAGQASAVTISTNMAGRGTDIKLGDGVQAKGGLFVLGTERHEARRIDNQLRGRSGRQGDPGETQFFVSLEDDIMRIFGGDRIKRLMQRLRVPENEAIENALVSKALEGAQQRVEGHYFDMRKQVLSYDDVLNRQRNAIYTLRRSLLIDGRWKEPNSDPMSLHEKIVALVREQAELIVTTHTSAQFLDEWNLEEIAETLHSLSGLPVTDIQGQLATITQHQRPEGMERIQEALREKVDDLLRQRLDERAQALGQIAFANLERAAALRSIDLYWMDHLDVMDYLRTGIGLRGYGQRDPLVEYQKEGHRLFQELLAQVKASIVDIIFKAEAVKQETVQGVEQHQSALEPHRITNSSSPAPATVTTASADQVKNPYKNVGRNAPCPCGSGKKFKRCHGA